MVDLQKVSRDILNWTYSREVFLNVVSVPYNTPLIFMETIIEYISQNKKVLYVTNDDKNCLIIKKLKEIGIRDYSNIKDALCINNTLIGICNIEIFENIKEKYDIVIIDDISKYSDYSSCDIKDLVLQNYIKGCKYIVYSIDCIFQEEKEIILPVRSNLVPMVEPRIISTRIDLSREVPYLAYDYITYSIKLSRNIVIFVPNEDNVNSVYRYISILLKRKGIEVSYFIKGITDDKSFLNYIKEKKSVVMVTDDFDKENIISKDTDIMVLLCDDLFFTYKRLIFLCGKVGRNGHGMGEAIFISQSSTYDMERCADKARCFNKDAWEMGFLNM